MPGQYDKGKEFRPDQMTLDTRALNEQRRATPRTITGKSPINVQQVGDRYVISMDQTGEGQEDLTLFMLVGEYDDFLACVPFSPGDSVQADTIARYMNLLQGYTGDSTDQAETAVSPSIIHYIAKPFMLRRTPFDKQYFHNAFYVWDTTSPPNGPKIDTRTAYFFGTNTVSITSITNAIPFVVTATNHGFATGDQVGINGVVGLLEVNVVWTITVIDQNTFSLDNTAVGKKPYTSGGLAARVTSTETQVIDPPYSVTELLTARKCPTSLRTVPQPQGGQTFTLPYGQDDHGDPLHIDIEDINTAGRSWFAPQILTPADCPLQSFFFEAVTNEVCNFLTGHLDVYKGSIEVVIDGTACPQVTITPKTKTESICQDIPCIVCVNPPPLPICAAGTVQPYGVPNNLCFSVNGVQLQIQGFPWPLIAAGGRGYTVGDIINVLGGIYTQQGQVKINSVSAGGFVTGVTLTTAMMGIYSVLPANPASTFDTSNGTATGLTLNLDQDNPNGNWSIPLNGIDGSSAFWGVQQSAFSWQAVLTYNQFPSATWTMQLTFASGVNWLNASATYLATGLTSCLFPITVNLQSYVVDLDWPTSIVLNGC